MTIEKNDRVYTAKENKASWTVSRKCGHIDILYNVPKEFCPTFDELKAFVTENELF